MSDEDLSELERLERAATPAGWTVSADDPTDVVVWGPDEDWLANVGNWARQHGGVEDPVNPDDCSRQYVEIKDMADAKLIATMRNALPKLIAALREARADATQARDAVLKAGRDPKWAAVYAWMDDHKDQAVKMLSDHCGEYEREVAMLRAERDTALATAGKLQARLDNLCKCSLRTRTLGDGCEVCNPELAAEIAAEADAREQGLR